MAHKVQYTKDKAMRRNNKPQKPGSQQKHKHTKTLTITEQSKELNTHNKTHGG